MNKLFSSVLLWDVSHIPVNSLGITTDEDSRALVWSTLSSTFPIKYTVLQRYSRTIKAALTLVLSALWKITACSNNVKNSILLCPRSVTLVERHYLGGSLSLHVTGEVFIRNENTYMEEGSLFRGWTTYSCQNRSEWKDALPRRDLCSGL